jgi:Kelch motif
MRKSRAFFPTVYYEYENSLYVFGGRNKVGDVGECEKYVIGMNKWVSIKNLPTSRNGSSAVIIDQYVFVMGGNSENIGQLDTIEQYFINYDKWDTLRIKLATPVSDF